VLDIDVCGDDLHRTGTHPPIRMACTIVVGMSIWKKSASRD
jgi:hypothetical protein